MQPNRYTPSLVERYTQTGLWGQVPTILERIEAHASNWPSKEAVVDANSRLSWGDVKLWTDRVALGLLERGIARDSVIMAQLPNLAETWLLRFSFQKAGIIGLTTPVRFGFRELTHLLRETEAVGLVVAPEYIDKEYWPNLERIRKDLPRLQHLFVVGEGGPKEAVSIRRMAEETIGTRYPADHLKRTMVRPLEVEALITTSGTTGLPKAIEYVALPCSTQEVYIRSWRLTPDDAMGALIPLYGGAAATCWNVAPWLGSKVVMLEKFDPEEALRVIERERITVANGVPTQMVRMVNHPRFSKYDLSSLRYFVYSGAACSPGLARKVEEAMGCIVLTFYGAAEVAGFTMLTPEDTPEKRYFSIGRPRPGVEIRLLDEEGRDVSSGEVGEIVGRGATCPSGYFHDLDATRQAWGGELDGWYRTGDLGRLDEEGYLYLMGRKKDVIIRGGQNIIPAEVEHLLCSHPAVAQAAVIPMPDEELGERMCAYVSLKSGRSFDLEEMVAFLKSKDLAVYKLPERLEIKEEFPQSAGEKISKKELIEEMTQKLRAEGKIKS